MPFGYPVMLELAGRRCVVIGARRRARGQGRGTARRRRRRRPGGRADARRAARRRWRHLTERRRWNAGRGGPTTSTARSSCVASSATPASATAIAREARGRRALVNVMDDIPNCDWSAPSDRAPRRAGAVDRHRRRLARAGEAAPRGSCRRSSARNGRRCSRCCARCARRRCPPCPTSRRAPDAGRDALDLDEAAALVREGRSDELAARLRTAPARPEAPGHDRARGPGVAGGRRTRATPS